MINSEKRTGILAAGNWIMDQVKVIDKFPSEQSLVNIMSEYASNGGSAYNILMALVKMQAAFKLEGIGLVGNDHNGHTIVSNCKDVGIDTQQIHIHPTVPTSYTIVASVNTTGKRTFFHHRGANALLDQSHFNLEISNAKIFHLGYLLLLDTLDEVQMSGFTAAAEVLKSAKQLGYLTSVDLVSEDSNRFAEIIPCSLPFVDVLFLNEFEASKLSGIDITAEESIYEMDTLGEQAITVLFEMGVNEWIIIHRPEGVWAAHRNGERYFQPSIKLPQGKIVGANGAGDALAAGVLFGIHEDWSMEKSLKLGVCAAASSLSHATCSDGILPYDQCLVFKDQYGFNDIVSVQK